MRMELDGISPGAGSQRDSPEASVLSVSLIQSMAKWGKAQGTSSFEQIRGFIKLTYARAAPPAGGSSAAMTSVFTTWTADCGRP